MEMKNENCDYEQKSIVHYIIVNTVLIINTGVIYKQHCTSTVVQYSEAMSCKILY